MRPRCSPRSVVYGDRPIRLMPIFVGVRCMVPNESAVIENASFLFRSLYFQYEVPD